MRITFKSSLLTSTHIFTLPEKGVEFTIYYELSGVGSNGVLMQKRKVIAYVSRILKTYEKKYPTHNLELVVVLFVLKLWRHYMYGVHYEFFMDQQSLVYIFIQQDLNLR